MPIAMCGTVSSIASVPGSGTDTGHRPAGPRLHRLRGAALAIAAGAASGVVMGLVIAFTRAHPILVSLSMMIFLRGLGESESPRTLLRGLSGAELVELPGHDECCGFGGSFAVRLPEVSTAILDKKLISIEATGARCVVACDAGCLMQIAGGLRRRGSAVRALHLAEVLGEPRP